MSDPESITLNAPVPAIVVGEHGSLAARKAFNAAFALAQGAYGELVKNRTVKIVGESKSGARVEYTFRYADMQEIGAKTRPALAANGLSTTGQMVPVDKGVMLSLVLAHAEGFERYSEVFVGYGEDPKKFGALLSYMRRYMKQNLLDVAADDDLDEDGQGIDGAGDRDFDTGGQRAAAPKAAPTPARRPRTPAPAPEQQQSDPPPEPPPEEGLSTTKPGAQEQAPAEPPAESPAAAPAAQHDPEEDGELASEGERNFVIKRCKTRGGDMRAVLAQLGYTFLNAETLENCTKFQFTKIKGAV